MTTMSIRYTNFVTTNCCSPPIYLIIAIIFIIAIIVVISKEQNEGPKPLIPLTNEEIIELKECVDNHKEDFTNPHCVTLDQACQKENKVNCDIDLCCNDIENVRRIQVNQIKTKDQECVFFLNNLDMNCNSIKNFKIPESECGNILVVCENGKVNPLQNGIDGQQLIFDSNEQCCLKWGPPGEVDDRKKFLWLGTEGTGIPTSGQILYNDPNPNSITNISIHKIDKNLCDASGVLSAIQVCDALKIVEFNQITNKVVAEFKVNSIILNTNNIILDVTLYETNGVFTPGKCICIFICCKDRVELTCIGNQGECIIKDEGINNKFEIRKIKGINGIDVTTDIPNDTICIGTTGSGGNGDKVFFCFNGDTIDQITTFPTIIWDYFCEDTGVTGSGLNSLADPTASHHPLSFAAAPLAVGVGNRATTKATYSFRTQGTNGSTDMVLPFLTLNKFDKTNNNVSGILGSLQVNDTFDVTSATGSGTPTLTGTYTVDDIDKFSGVSGGQINPWDEYTININSKFILGPILTFPKAGIVGGDLTIDFTTFVGFSIPSGTIFYDNTNISLITELNISVIDKDSNNFSKFACTLKKGDILRFFEPDLKLNICGTFYIDKVTKGQNNVILEGKSTGSGILPMDACLCLYVLGNENPKPLTAIEIFFASNLPKVEFIVQSPAFENVLQLIANVSGGTYSLHWSGTSTTFNSGIKTASYQTLVDGVPILGAPAIDGQNVASSGLLFNRVNALHIISLTSGLHTLTLQHNLSDVGGNILEKSLRGTQHSHMVLTKIGP